MNSQGNWSPSFCILERELLSKEKWYQVALLIIHQTIPLADPEQPAILHDIKIHGHLSVDLSADVPVSRSDAELRINLKTA